MTMDTGLIFHPYMRPERTARQTFDTFRKRLREFEHELEKPPVAIRKLEPQEEQSPP